MNEWHLLLGIEWSVVKVWAGLLVAEFKGSACEKVRLLFQGLETQSIPLA